MNKISLLQDVQQPVAKARGLPNAHYVDPRVFQQENQALLYGTWAGIGFGKDIPNAGDVIPITFLKAPLLCVRDQHGKICVYHNVCRHRGMKLVSEAGNVGKIIRCPYHSWCYDLGGNLRTSPHVGGPGHNTHDDIARDQLGLLPVRSYVWHDVIFVNMDGNAAEFTEHAADLMQRWQEFDQPVYHGGNESGFVLDVQCNWKLAVENYCESYHLPWVHPGLNSYSRLEDHYNIEHVSVDDASDSLRSSGADYAGQGTLVYQQLRDEKGRQFPDFQELSEKWNTGAEYIAVFPNVLLGVHRDHFFAIVLEAVDQDHTREHIELYYSTVQAATAPEYLTLRQENAHLWKTVFREDIFVVEGMQQGRYSPDFDGGKFSPVMDTPTHLFHQWAARRFIAQHGE